MCHMSRTVEGEAKIMHPFVRRLQDAQDRMQSVAVLPKVSTEGERNPVLPSLRNALERVREEYAGDDRISDFELHEFYVAFLEDFHNLKTDIKDPNKNFNL